MLSLLELLFLGERLRLRELLGPAVTELFEVCKLLDLEEALELDELFELVKLGDSTGLVYPLWAIALEIAVIDLKSWLEKVYSAPGQLHRSWLPSLPSQSTHIEAFSRNKLYIIIFRALKKS